MSYWRIGRSKAHIFRLSPLQCHSGLVIKVPLAFVSWRSKVQSSQHSWSFVVGLVNMVVWLAELLVFIDVLRIIDCTSVLSFSSKIVINSWSIINKFPRWLCHTALKQTHRSTFCKNITSVWCKHICVFIYWVWKLYLLLIFILLMLLLYKTILIFICFLV